MAFFKKIKISTNSKSLNRFAVTNQNDDLIIETNNFNPKLNRTFDMNSKTLIQKFYQHLGEIHLMSPELIQYKYVHNLYALFEASEIGYYFEMAKILRKILDLKKELSSENPHFSPDMPNIVNFHTLMGIKYFEAKLNKFLHMKSLEEIYARKLWPYVVNDGLSIQLECEEGKEELSYEYLYKILTFFEDNIASQPALTRIKIDVLKEALRQNIMTSALKEEIYSELSKLESIVLPLEDE